MRGIAAVMVVFWRLLPGFPPKVSQIERPWYGFVNGAATVGFFFVLSGFVLTRRSFQVNDADALARGAIKRWPRPAGTVGIAGLVGWALFPLGW